MAQSQFVSFTSPLSSLFIFWKIKGLVPYSFTLQSPRNMRPIHSSSQYILVILLQTLDRFHRRTESKWTITWDLQGFFCKHVKLQDKQWIKRVIKVSQMPKLAARYTTVTSNWKNKTAQNSPALTWPVRKKGSEKWSRRARSDPCARVRSGPREKKIIISSHVPSSSTWNSRARTLTKKWTPEGPCWLKRPGKANVFSPP